MGAGGRPIPRSGPAPRKGARMSVDPSQADAMRQIVNAYWMYRAVYAVAKLGVADFLAVGPKSSQELAALTESHPVMLYRLLRLVATGGVLQEDDGRRF